MKTTIIYSFLSLFIATGLFAQNRTTVTATNYDVSDNLDLKAVASIFGESRNLQDFEQRLNDPGAQISNLDLNGDNQVDYLRVIEATQDNTRLVIVQAVLDRDVYQDVATIEAERNNSAVQVQVVGDPYIYGPNYIYEPVFVSQPVFFNTWWSIGYSPYVSSWYWGYYPSYWHVWNPMPVYRYRNHVHVHVNVHNHYNYVNVRRSRTAISLHSGRRGDAYAKRYPERAFTQRNANVANRYELDKTRRTDRGRTEGTRSNRAVKSEGTRSNTRNADNPRSRETATRTKNYRTRNNPTGSRDNAAGSATRSSDAVKTRSSSTETRTRTESPRTVSRDNQPVRANREATPRAARPEPQRVERQATPRVQSQPAQRIDRQSAPQVQRQQAPRMERQSAPQVQRQQAPRMERQSAPQVQRQAAPRMEQSGGGGGNRGNAGGGGRRN